MKELFAADENGPGMAPRFRDPSGMADAGLRCVFQPVEYRAVGRVKGVGDGVYGGRAWHIEPVGADAGGEGVGLRLQSPTGVIAGPTEDELLDWNSW